MISLLVNMFICLFVFVLSYNQINKIVIFEENESLKGELCPDERRSLGKKETWKEFNEWQRRKYLINFTNMEWFPATFSCLHKATNISYKFTFLATIVRGCQLFVWQAQLPLVKNHSHLYRAVAANTLLFNPCILAWYGTTNANGKFVLLGNLLRCSMIV